MKNKTILIAIAFGTSVRDVLRNDTYKYLKEDKKNNIVILAQHIDENFKAEFGGSNVTFDKLIEYKASLSERVIGYFHRAILRHKCRTIDLGNTLGDTNSIDKIKSLTSILIKVFGLPRMNSFVHFLYKYFTGGGKYKSIFEKYRPDLVIVTRVLNFSNDYPVMRTAVIREIPVVVLVSSWDNLTSKAFFPFAMKKLVVWNDVMKREAIDLFQYPEADVFVSGIPRYDELFKSETFRSREEFYGDLRINPSEKVITYATGSKTTGITQIDKLTPEPQIVKMIAAAIGDNKLNATHLIVRLHPQALIQDYKELESLEFVTIQIPGSSSSFQDRLFSKEDDVQLGELMKHSDVVINLASTITIDAAVFDTPIVCINFDVFGERDFKNSVKKFYEFDHYAKLTDTGGVVLANSFNDLLNKVNYEISNPQHLTENRKKIVKQQCVYTDGKSGERIALFLSQLLKNKID